MEKAGRTRRQSRIPARLAIELTRVKVGTRGAGRYAGRRGGIEMVDGEAIDRLSTRQRLCRCTGQCAVRARNARGCRCE